MCDKLDEAAFQWHVPMRIRDMPVSGLVLYGKAAQLHALAAWWVRASLTAEAKHIINLKQLTLNSFLA